MKSESTFPLAVSIRRSTLPPRRSENHPGTPTPPTPLPM
jgi:hypothetical protein